MIKTLCIFGTRPEAIKMAPVCVRLQQDPRFEAKTCVTGQHREMLDSLLSFFEIVPEFDLDVMRPGHSLSSLSAAILTGLGELFSDYKPDVVLVHGDTTTSFVSALASFYEDVPVAHVEACLLYTSPSPRDATLSRMPSSA